MAFKNFRDLGGFIGFGGKKVKKNSLYRSGEPTNLNPEEMASMRDSLGIETMIDFRGVSEVQDRPISKVDGINYKQFNVLSKQMKQQHDVGFEHWIKMLMPGDARRYLLDEVYIDLVLSDEAQASYRCFIDSLLATEGATLFHCHIGQDRAGWAAVIILKILGVSDEDIMEDYLATIDATNQTNKKIVEKFKKHGLNGNQLLELEDLISIKATYLQTSFAVVDRIYQSFDNYLQQALHVTPEEIATLRDLYLE